MEELTLAIGDIIVGIDIGTSKVSLVVGEVNNFNQIEIICSTSHKCSAIKKGKIVDEEATMSILQRELGSQEYVNRLVNQNQSVAKKIYNWVIDKLNKFNGGKNEKLFWTDMKNKFETAYNQEFRKNEDITKEEYTEYKKKYNLKQELIEENIRKLKEEKKENKKENNLLKELKEKNQISKLTRNIISELLQCIYVKEDGSLRIKFNYKSCE